MTPGQVPAAGAAPALPAIRTLLVPVDDSDVARLALPVAVELADRLDAHIRVITVVGRPEDERSARALLRNLRVDRLVGVDIVVEARPAVAIGQAVGRVPDGVLCMATRGRGRTAAVLGSVAAEVVTGAREPLILVGRSIGRAEGHHWEGEPIDLRPLRGGGVVACVDRAPNPEAVVAAAGQWARRLKERLTVIHVASPDVPPGRIDDRPPDEGAERGPEELVRSLAETAASAGADATGRVIDDPVGVVAGLHAYLRSHPASLIVLNSRNRTGLRRLAGGSTAARIVERSPSPVLMVPR